MSEAAKIKDGDFVVTRGAYKIDCVEVIRVTEKLIFYMDVSWRTPRERRLRLQDVLFSGPQAVAKRLKEHLQSSYQQKIDDHRSASLRQSERDAKFITEARCSHSWKHASETVNNRLVASTWCRKCMMTAHAFNQQAARASGKDN